MKPSSNNASMIEDLIFWLFLMFTSNKVTTVHVAQLPTSTWVIFENHVFTCILSIS